MNFIVCALVAVAFIGGMYLLAIQWFIAKDKTLNTPITKHCAECGKQIETSYVRRYCSRKCWIEALHEL